MMLTVAHAADSINLIEELLADKRSENTRRAYKKDLEDFFVTMAQGEPTPILVGEFLRLTRTRAVPVVLRYKANMVQRGLKEATVNRRLAAIKAIVTYAKKVGVCEWNLANVKGEKVENYRDTSGITTDQMADVLSIPDRNTIKGKRDYAILRLAWDNALRRSEIVKTDVKDFDHESGTLAIIGKGKGTQKVTITLSAKTAQSLLAWLRARGKVKPDDPLFIALDRSSKGHRLTGRGLAKMVTKIAQTAGITKTVSLHRLRHSAITAALDATNGNVALVQKLSRHKKIETLMIYEDHRTDAQGKVTELLAAIA